MFSRTFLPPLKGIFTTEVFKLLIIADRRGILGSEMTTVRVRVVSLNGEL